MAGPDEITVNQEGGSGGAGHAIEQTRRSKEFGATNDPGNLKNSVSDQGSLIEPKKEEDANQNENPGDGQTQTTHSIPENRDSRFSEAKYFAKNFVKHRNEDLNVILIVAGLFSAVTSAFIIYIHPQLQVDPNEESATLLRVLLYKTDETTFGDDVPEVPNWTGPTRTIVASLILLYLGLAATMASVLFAILAKQLLNLYAFMGTLKSNNENDRSQQRILKWFTVGLHLVVLLLSLLLQFSLLLLSCALTVYIWKVNIAVASVILVITVCAVPIYGTFIILALANVVSHFWERKS